MKAGRELNKLVYEKIFGNDLTGFVDPDGGFIQNNWVHPHFVFDDGIAGRVRGVKLIKVPDYSGNIADAWLVREWLINNVGGVRLEHLCDAEKPELCEVWDGWKYIRVQAETTPLAICLVAIMIVDNVNIVDKGR